MMKRLLTLFLMFSSVAIGMDRPRAIALVQQKAEQERRDKLSHELGTYLLAMTSKYPPSNLSQKDREYIKMLIVQGANVNQKFIYAKGSFIFYPLVLAVQLGDVEVIKELIAYGADVEIKDKFGYTLLMKAAQDGLVNVVRLLLEGTPVHTEQLKEISKPGQKTYLSLLPPDLQAITFGYIRGIKADPNIKNYKGNTALDLAIESLKNLIDDQKDYPNLNIHTDADQKIRSYQQIIDILAPITAQPKPKWWQRWIRRNQAIFISFS